MKLCGVMAAEAATCENAPLGSDPPDERVVAIHGRCDAPATSSSLLLCTKKVTVGETEDDDDDAPLLPRRVAPPARRIRLKSFEAREVVVEAILGWRRMRERVFVVCGAQSSCLVVC